MTTTTNTAARVPKGATTPPPCYRCGGTGTYAWGGSVNGVPRHTGPCFACQGGGEYRPTQGRFYRRRRAQQG